MPTSCMQSPLPSTDCSPGVRGHGRAHPEGGRCAHHAAAHAGVRGRACSARWAQLRRAVGAQQLFAPRPAAAACARHMHPCFARQLSNQPTPLSPLNALCCFPPSTRQTGRGGGAAAAERGRQGLVVHLRVHGQPARHHLRPGRWHVHQGAMMPVLQLPPVGPCACLCMAGNLAR